MFNLSELKTALTSGSAARGTALECGRAVVELLFKELVTGKSPLGCELELLFNRLENPQDPIWKMLPTMQRMMLGAALSTLNQLVEDARAQETRNQAAR